MKTNKIGADISWTINLSMSTPRPDKAATSRLIHGEKRDATDGPSNTCGVTLKERILLRICRITVQQHLSDDITKCFILRDSEFFHGKDWEIKKPKLQKGTNPEFWINKIERNMQRDIENDQRLLCMGWTVIHFWGSDILNDTETCVQVIEEAIFDNILNKV